MASVVLDTASQQSDDGSVDITYHFISGLSQVYTVSLEVQATGWITAKSVSGDIGQVTADGASKSITWSSPDVERDEQQTSQNIRIKATI